jgi:hypothetical protein
MDMGAFPFDFTGLVFGCTDPLASNYVEDADYATDSFTCEYD